MSRPDLEAAVRRLIDGRPPRYDTRSNLPGGPRWWRCKFCFGTWAKDDPPAHDSACVYEELRAALSAPLTKEEERAVTDDDIEQAIFGEIHAHQRAHDCPGFDCIICSTGALSAVEVVQALLRARGRAS